MKKKNLARIMMGVPAFRGKEPAKPAHGTKIARAKKMAKNAYLEKQKFERQFYLDVGIRYGRQQILDMLSLVLHDPEIMKKDTFGKNRLLKIVQGLGDYIDKYQPAWERSDETDYYRVKLDEALADIYGEELHDSFDKRYEFSPEYDYKRGKWSK